MYRQRNVLLRSPSHLTCSLCIVELHVTVKNIKILSVAEKYSYGEFMSPATIKLIQVFF
jgi:hypothetical protein